MKNIAISLLSLTTLSIAAIPAMADQVIMQQSDSYIYQDGSGHRGVQESVQIHRSRSPKKPSAKHSDYGSVQTNVQEGMQVGEDSSFRQTTIQRNEMRGRMGRGARKK